MQLIRRRFGYLLFFTFFISCTNVKKAVNGQLDDGNYFELLYFPYVSMEHHRGVRDCRIFSAQIKNKQNKIMEELIWYSCDSMLPLKIYFTQTADTPRRFITNLLIADTTVNARFPLTDEEEKTFWAMNAYLVDHHFPAFIVHGFATLSKQDNARRLPFVKQAVLMKSYHRN